MNNKKKNKNKHNKPHNPVPKTEAVNVTDNTETILDVNSEILVKSDDRAPELLSEAVKEIKDLEDAPKKPKRNRGKKNKNNKEGDNDIKEQKFSETNVEETNIPCEFKEKVTIDFPETLKEVNNEANIAPTAPKKKVKNKNPDQSKEIKVTEQEITIGPIKDEDKDKDGNFIGDVKIVTCVPVNLDDEKHGKKKNKKKRNNSDRSDKAEDISCISAFQKLMEPRDDIKDGKQSTKVETLSKDIEKITDKITEESFETSQEGSKSKKKNKKEKRNPHKTEGKEDIDKPPDVLPAILLENIKPSLITDVAPSSTLVLPQEQPISATLTDKTKPSVVINVPSIAQEINISDEISFIEKEKSLNPKAKIAKPVQKIDKGKEDLNFFSENISTSAVTSEDSLKQAKKANEIKSSDLVSEQQKKPHLEELAVVDPVLDKQKKTEPEEVNAEASSLKEEVTSLKSDTKIQSDHIKIPDTNAAKKRKKSPKKRESEVTKPSFESMKSMEKSVNSVTLAQITKIRPAKDESGIPDTSVAPKESTITMLKEKSCEDTKRVETVLRSDTSHPSNIPIPLGFSDIFPTETTIQSSNKQSTMKTTELDILKPEQLPIPDAEIRKKRKKLPKLLTKLEPTSEVKEVIFDTNTPESSEVKASIENTNDDDELPDFMPSLEDINIKNVKTGDSKDSLCDIMPDIQNARAASQITVDKNNNMVIQEIGTEQIKLNVSSITPDTPFIEGASKTLSTPGLVQAGIVITDTDSSSKLSGTKTDLKSKVLEVNQDMEDLRLSIERSLAELTAMEKNERTTEKSFEAAQAKLEEIKDLATKQKDNIKKEEQIKLTQRHCEIRSIGDDYINQTKKVEVEQEQAKDKFVPLEIQGQVKLSEIIGSTSKFSKPDCVENYSMTIPKENKTEPAQSEIKAATTKPTTKTQELIVTPELEITHIPPVIPARKDNKGKGKKKKGRPEIEHSSTTSTAEEASISSTGACVSQDASQDTQNEQKSEKTENTQEQGKTKSASTENTNTLEDSGKTDEIVNFEPIENFEDALTSSTSQDDVNKTFEIIANERNNTAIKNNPDINITAPVEDDEEKDKDAKVNPVSQPKNLLGHPAIPARLSKTDYKKEKNKTPNARQAKVKIKDSTLIETNKQSKESQTENKKLLKDSKEVTTITNENDYIYKYSFRKVFLPSACHVCKKDLKQSRVSCGFCNLVFYCSPKHKDEDNSQHQALCFAVSTISHLKGLKYIYGDAQSVIGQEYRLLRMQAIISSEKVLKRRLLPYEQEMLLYPRVCGDAGCREWKQGKLKDCEGCGQISYCTIEHLPPTHQRWCKSYSLYQRLVSYQQTHGRLEPKLPTKVIVDIIPDKMNEVLASLYEERIDMNDIQYAALTQIATAPLTAAFSYQLYLNKINSTSANGVNKNSSFTIHVVGAELPFEADVLNKWEVFFLHLRPEDTLIVVLIGPDLNPGKLPVELLGKIRLCENCRVNNRRVIFDFQDGKTYDDFWSSDFTTPDLVCAFNPSIHRTSVYNGKDSWQSTIKCILKQKVPFLITSYTLNELKKDLERIKTSSEVDFTVISEAKLNSFASVRPDRNFISDDEMPLLFKNYCFTVVAGNV